MGVTTQGTIYGINGPVVRVRGDHAFQMMEMVLVGHEKLIGEVIRVLEDETIVQVYENTTGVKPGEPVIPTGRPLTVKLGPGIIGNIFDGIERPLTSIAQESGAFIDRGTLMDNLDTEKLWDVKVLVHNGDTVKPGMVIAQVQETPSVVHHVMVPPNIDGVVEYAANDGKYPITKTIVRIRKGKTTHDLTLVQEWPVRTPRPYKRRLPMNEPLITGQRVIDSLFPLAKGGTAAIQGGFGTGKTLTQHQLAKWSNADIIVYVGCGERGNEITQVLEDFPNLIDPRNNRPLMERTVLIANTSNMPVAAREASIYTGITLAEYYRDMGYHVALMADSTSRWAEALREISGRLEEMPAEEGFPAYLPSRLSEFYERAGMIETWGREGLRIHHWCCITAGRRLLRACYTEHKKVYPLFWALDKSLAYTRHYPAINWMDSYSEYTEDLRDWYTGNTAPDFMEKRERLSRILQEEGKLLEIVKLIGIDILPDEQKLILESARVIRQGFLQQNAYHEQDTYVPVKKQYHMMKSVLHLHDQAARLVSKGIPVSVITRTGVFEEVVKIKYTISNQDMEAFETLNSRIDSMLSDIEESYRGTERRRYA